MQTSEGERKILQFFGRHFVTIESVYDTLPKEGEKQVTKAYVISAFVVSILGKWVIMTAGHVLDEIEQAKQHGYKFGTWHLGDHWGNQVIDDTVIPFDLDGVGKAILYDPKEKYAIGIKSGVDYGVIIVPPMYEDLMRKNNIVPIDEAGWGALEDDYDYFVMLGVPTERCETTDIGNQKYLAARELLLIDIRRLTDVPPEMVRTNPCLYGQISDPLILEDSVTLESIKGMSGCPIFGFQNDRYWLVAMQSAWYPNDHRIIGVGIQDFGKFMHFQLQGGVEEHEQEAHETL